MRCLPDMSCRSSSNLAEPIRVGQTVNTLSECDDSSVTLERVAAGHASPVTFNVTVSFIAVAWIFMLRRRCMGYRSSVSTSVVVNKS